METRLSDDLVARARQAAEAAAVDAIERAVSFAFTRFQCATNLPADLMEADEGVQAAFRQAVRVAMRERLEDAWPQRVHDHERPEVAVLARPDRGGAWLEVAPVFVAGRYCKLERGISQTVFYCPKCRGRRKSCDDCGGSGRLVPESVDDFVRPCVQDAVDGRSSAFHGAGREDVDVRMLGEGRSFVVSVRDPKRRDLDAAAVEAAVAEASGGRVTVSGLRMVDKATLKKLTTERRAKRYRLVIRAADGLPQDAAQRIAALSGTDVRQRTPQRVSATRADKVRVRRVLDVEVEDAGSERMTVALRTEAGTYVKELVSGDDGRTDPSVSSILGVACVCETLDVLEAS